MLELRVTSLLPAVPEAGAWLVDPEVVGVNTMMLGILAEVFYRWIEPVKSLVASTGEDLLAVPQSLSIGAELQDGATASFHLSFRVPRGPGSSVEIYGTDGVLDYKLLVEKPGGLVEDEELFGMTQGDSGMHPIEMPVEEQRDSGCSGLRRGRSLHGVLRGGGPVDLRRPENSDAAHTQDGLLGQAFVARP